MIECYNDSISKINLVDTPILQIIKDCEGLYNLLIKPLLFVQLEGLLDYIHGLEGSYTNNILKCFIFKPLINSIILTISTGSTSLHFIRNDKIILNEIPKCVGMEGGVKVWRCKEYVEVVRGRGKGVEVEEGRGGDFSDGESISYFSF